MTFKLMMESWIYVPVQNPGGDERITGQYDDHLGISYIPSFLDRDSAQQGLLNIAKERGARYEIQAILFEELLRAAAMDAFFIFVLDHTGRILAKYTPNGELI
jgi:hypothetical protein